MRAVEAPADAATASTERHPRPSSLATDLTPWVAVGCWLALGVGSCADPDQSQATPSEPGSSAEASDAALTDGGAAPPDGAADATASAPPPPPGVGHIPAWPTEVTPAGQSWPPSAAAAAAAAAAAPGDRVVSKVRHLWVRPRMGSNGWLGYLSLGDAVRVRGGEAASARVGDGPSDLARCEGWYAVEPRGYVCVGENAVLATEDPELAELRATAANPDSPWPYHYAESLGICPVYGKVPEAAEQRRSEMGWEDHMGKVRRGREADTEAAVAAIDPQLAGVGLGLTGRSTPQPVELPPLGRPIRKRIGLTATMAYTRSFDAGGRSWLLSWDRGLVPADRVRLFPQSRFHGVVLGEEVSLPMAWFRIRPRPQYRLTSDGRIEATGSSWPRQGWAGLTDNRVEVEGVTYLETTDDNLWCAEPDATVLRQATKLPPLVARRKSGRHTWMDVSILDGWLVAYEGERPVYATLISAGRGGMPAAGIPAIDTAATPAGQFTITGKFLTATMTSSSDPNIVHTEVQYTQNFSGPHTLHAAYWHDDWGEKKSGGCVNLAPIDAKRIFAWTEPPLPPGWHGVRWKPGDADSTIVDLHR